MKQQTFFYTRMLFFLFFILFLGMRLVSAQVVKEEKTVTLRLALPFHVLDDLTRKDAQLAIDMWTKEIVQSIEKHTGIHFKVTAEFLESDYAQRNTNINKEYDLLVLGALDFFDYNVDKFWESIALTEVKGHFPEEFLVLVRKDRHYNSIRDLKRKSIIFTNKQDKRLIQYWLNTFLKKNHLDNINDFFISRKFVGKDSKAILSVFFNKIDACIVSYNQFQTMVELNPQIGRDLVVVTKSPAFARGMVCLRKNLDEQIKHIITNAVINLSKYQRGRQILAFFGQSDMILSKPEYLESLHQLVKESKTLDKKQ